MAQCLFFGYDGPMSEQADETTGTSGDSTQSSQHTESSVAGDDQLPEDLRATEDNPLARHPDVTGDADDEIGADTQSEPETAPLDQESAEYGGAGRSES